MHAGLTRPVPADDAETRLAALWAAAREEMARIEFVSEPWMPPLGTHAGEPVSNVVVVGAGMSGLAIAFGLKRHGVEGVRVIDRARRGAEGPWVTSARMRTLRSPKSRSGPDLGIPSLTPRAWYEARYGREAWQACERFTRSDWMDYLDWFRETVGIRVENETALVRLADEPGTDGRLVRLELETPEGPRTALARRVVLATGLDGSGGPIVPEPVRALPARLWTHSADICEDSHLAGKDVAVIGSATSAFDWAATALQHGAASVTLFARGTDLPRHEILLFTHFPGYLGHFAALPAEQRWRLNRISQRFKVPPTQDQYERAVTDPRFRMVFGAPLLGCAEEGGRVRLATGRGAFLADHVLLGTGYAEADLAMRPELAELARAASLWSDRFIPPPGEEDEVLARHPFLGPDFAFVPRTNEEWVRRVYLFTNGSAPSVGPISNGITGLKFGAPMIVNALVGALFAEDAAYHEARMDRYRAVRFDPHFDTVAHAIAEVP